MLNVSIFFLFSFEIVFLVVYINVCLFVCFHNMLQIYCHTFFQHMVDDMVGFIYKLIILLAISIYLYVYIF